MIRLLLFANNHIRRCACVHLVILSTIVIGICLHDFGPKVNVVFLLWLPLRTIKLIRAHFSTIQRAFALFWSFAVRQSGRASTALLLLYCHLNIGI